MEAMTLSEIQKMVHGMDEALGENEVSFKTATLLIALLHMPPDAESLGRLLKLPVAFINERLSRLRAGGVIDEGDNVCADRFDEEHGGVAFWMDVAVAEGLLGRVSDGDEPAYVQPDENWPDVIDAK